MSRKTERKKHHKTELIFGGSTEMRIGENMYYAEVCFVTAATLSDSGRASTIRRNFYRIIERYAWKTPLGWLMDIETCTEIAPKLEQLDKEHRELTGKSFIGIYRAILGVQELKKILENSTPPNREDVATRLRKILETQETVAVKT